MIKIAFDTNVILDAAMGRPGSEKSQELMQAVVSGPEMQDLSQKKEAQSEL